MKRENKIYIAGHNGMVGSAIHRHLLDNGYRNIITRSSKELDLREKTEVSNFFEAERPEYVFMAAAKVGGIVANNTYRAEFIYDNLCIQNNIIHQAYLQKVTKLLFLGSSCIYPKLCSQPIKEEYLLSGYLENSNEPYAIAKIAGVKMCQAYHEQYGCNFISVMPTNLYGYNDNYDLQNSHVLPALIRKFHDAKTNAAPTVTVWGTGTPRREFLFANDLAEACVFLMKNYDHPEIINIGSGHDISISELANVIKEIIDFKGEIIFDTTKPDGTPQKLLDVNKINQLGWKASTSLKDGVYKVYKDFIKNT